MKINVFERYNHHPMDGKIPYVIFLRLLSLSPFLMHLAQTNKQEIKILTGHLRTEPNVVRLRGKTIHPYNEKIISQ